MNHTFLICYFILAIYDIVIHHFFSIIALPPFSFLLLWTHQKSNHIFSMTQPMMLWRVECQSQEMEAMAPAQSLSRSKVDQLFSIPYQCSFLLFQTNHLCMERISTNKLIIIDDNGKALFYHSLISLSIV